MNNCVMVVEYVVEDTPINGRIVVKHYITTKEELWK